jgi:hypothetical protein
MSGQTDERQDLDELGKRIEQWRRTRTTRSPMPAELWKAAAALVPRHGLYAVMRELRLGYSSLKRRVRESTDPGHELEAATSSSAFIDLGVGRWPVAPECRIKIEDASGAKLRIELRSPSSGELATLVHAFMNGRRA